MYLDREKLLSISAQKVDVDELKEKLKGEMEQQNKQLQVMVNNVVTENIELKRRMSTLETDRTDFMRQLLDYQKQIDSIITTVDGLKNRLGEKH
jgi:hypothetical protein